MTYESDDYTLKDGTSVHIISTIKGETSGVVMLSGHVAERDAYEIAEARLGYVPTDGWRVDHAGEQALLTYVVFHRISETD